MDAIAADGFQRDRGLAHRAAGRDIGDEGRCLLAGLFVEIVGFTGQSARHQRRANSGGRLLPNGGSGQVRVRHPALRHD